MIKIKITMIVSILLGLTFNFAHAEEVPPKYILQEYSDTYSDEKEGVIALSKIYVETKDFNLDGSPEYFLSSALFCGSSGCGGPIYSKVGSIYCFVAFGYSQDLNLKGKPINFTCRKINERPTIYMEKLLK